MTHFYANYLFWIIVAKAVTTIVTTRRHGMTTDNSCLWPGTFIIYLLHLFTSVIVFSFLLPSILRRMTTTMDNSWYFFFLITVFLLTKYSVNDFSFLPLR
jgi:hypothetical protein